MFMTFQFKLYDFIDYLSMIHPCFILNLLENHLLANRDSITVTNEGHARAHDPGSAIVRVRMNLDLGTFAPQIIRSA